MARANKRVIALIGPSGSGKSCIGQILAVKLGFQFLDSDRQIEKDCSMSVTDIFRKEGESAFRRREAAFLEEFCAGLPQNTVLSTGGGLPVPEENWRLLDSVSILVYLFAPLEVLVTRINQGENRPLLSAGTGAVASKAALEGENELEALKARLGNLISWRERIYSRAQYKIDTSGGDPEELADKIISLTGVMPLNT